MLFKIYHSIYGPKRSSKIANLKSKLEKADKAVVEALEWMA